MKPQTKIATMILATSFGALTLSTIANVTHADEPTKKVSITYKHKELSKLTKAERQAIKKGIPEDPKQCATYYMVYKLDNDKGTQTTEKDATTNVDGAIDDTTTVSTTQEGITMDATQNVLETTQVVNAKIVQNPNYAQKTLPKTGERDMFNGLALLGAGILLVGVTVSPLTRKQKITSLMAITMIGGAVNYTNVSADFNGLSQYYDKTFQIALTEKLPKPTKIDGYTYVGYIVEFRDCEVIPDEPTTEVISSQTEKATTEAEKVTTESEKVTTEAEKATTETETEKVTTESEKVTTESEKVTTETEKVEPKTIVTSFETQRVDDPTKSVGEFTIVQEGKDRIVVDGKVVQEGQPQIIKVGTKDKELNTIVTAFKTERIEDHTVPKGVTVIVQEGKDEVVVDGKVVQKGQPQIVKVGTKGYENLTTIVPFETQRVEDPNQFVGYVEIINQGKDKVIVDGQVIEEGQPQIIKVGTRPVHPSATHEHFKTERIEDPTLPIGTTIIVQQGIDRVVVDGDVLSEGQPQIIKVGTKEVTPIVEEIPFETIYKGDSTQKAGTQTVETEGKNGLSVNGKVTKEPVTKVVNVGVKHGIRYVGTNNWTVDHPNITKVEGKDGVINEKTGEFISPAIDTIISVATGHLTHGVAKYEEQPFNIDNIDFEKGGLKDGVVLDRTHKTVVKQKGENGIIDETTGEFIKPQVTELVDDITRIYKEDKIVKEYTFIPTEPVKVVLPNGEERTFTMTELGFKPWIDDANKTYGAGFKSEDELFNAILNNPSIQNINTDEKGNELTGETRIKQYDKQSNTIYLERDKVIITTTTTESVTEEPTTVTESTTEAPTTVTESVTEAPTTVTESTTEAPTTVTESTTEAPTTMETESTTEAPTTMETESTTEAPTEVTETENTTESDITETVSEDVPETRMITVEDADGETYDVEGMFVNGQLVNGINIIHDLSLKNEIVKRYRGDGVVYIDTYHKAKDVIMDKKTGRWIFDRDVDHQVEIEDDEGR